MPLANARNRGPRPAPGSILALAALLTLLTLLPIAFPTTARAAGNQNAAIMLHALTPLSKTACVRTENVPANCLGYEAGVSHLALYPTTYFAYVLLVNGDPVGGVGGIQFGIDYVGGANGAADGAGIEIYSWLACSTLELVTPPGGGINAWPNPNSGTLLVWNESVNCQRSGNDALGVVATAGYFYIGAIGPDVLRLEPRQVDNAARVFNCSSQEDTFFACFDDFYFQLGSLGFGQPGYNPACLEYCPDPIVPTTWSDIKTLLE
jgi:hypothetical protein